MKNKKPEPEQLELNLQGGTPVQLELPLTSPVTSNPFDRPLNRAPAQESEQPKQMELFPSPSPSARQMTEQLELPLAPRSSRRVKSNSPSGIITRITKNISRKAGKAAKGSRSGKKTVRGVRLAKSTRKGGPGRHKRSK